MSWFSAPQGYAIKRFFLGFIIIKDANERKNKRTTISNDTLILIQFLIKVDIYRCSSFSPLIFPYILAFQSAAACSKDSGNSKERELLLTFDSSLCRGKAGDRHAEG